MHFDDRGTQENQTQRQHLSIFFIKDIIQWFNWKTQDLRTCPVVSLLANAKITSPGPAVQWIFWDLYWYKADGNINLSRHPSKYFCLRCWNYCLFRFISSNWIGPIQFSTVHYGNEYHPIGLLTGVVKNSSFKMKCFQFSLKGVNWFANSYQYCTLTLKATYT